MVIFNVFFQYQEGPQSEQQNLAYSQLSWVSNFGEASPKNHNSFPIQKGALLTWTSYTSLLDSSQLDFLGNIPEKL